MPVVAPCSSQARHLLIDVLYCIFLKSLFFLYNTILKNISFVNKTTKLFSSNLDREDIKNLGFPLKEFCLKFLLCIEDKVVFFNVYWKKSKNSTLKYKGSSIRKISKKMNYFEYATDFSVKLFIMGSFHFFCPDI